MTQTMRRFSGVVALATSMLSAGGTAQAQTSAGRASCADDRSPRQLFTGKLGDLRRLPSAGSAGILALGSAAAFGAHAIDRRVSDSVPSHGTGTFRPGTVIGGTPLELGAAFTAYAIGRSMKKPCIAALGADLVQAQLMAQVLTIGFKEATRRARPQGSGFSFPSGHTTMAFASATVLQRRYGWKAGVPAYAVASYVAASRVELKHHYLSDVAFGAALGIVVGRSIDVGHGRHLMLVPAASRHGAAVSFTVLGRP